MTDEMPATLTVYERVHAVLSDLPAIGKDSKAPAAMGGYAFRGIEQITAALKPLLAKHQVFMVPTVLERDEMTRSTAANKALYVVDLKIRFTFYGPDGENFAAEMWGQGSDSGDKAVQKAVTSAFKSMLAVTFCISDSESDAEAHDVPDTVTRPAPADKDRVAALVTRVAACHLGDWVKAQEFPWPWTVAACERIEAECDDLGAFDLDPTTESPSKPPEPESGGSADKPAETPEPVLKGRKRDPKLVEPDPKLAGLQQTLERTDAHAADVPLTGDSPVY